MKNLLTVAFIFLISCSTSEKKNPSVDFVPYEYEKSIVELRETSDDFMKRARADMEELKQTNETGSYRANNESLNTHPTPAWYEDAKLGIFFDWGLYSIAGYGEKGWSRARYPDWYLNHMIHDFKDYHRDTWGENFKRDDFIGLFNADGFSASEIIQLTKRAGAKYFVPFSKHHDGFCLWNSEYTHRDVVDMNPGRDITQELVDACEEAGIYHGFYFSVEDYEYPVISNEGELMLRLWSKRMAPDNAGVVVSDDEALTPFIPEKHDKLVSGKVPVQNFIDDYIVPQAKDFIDRYDPDILWFDGEWQRPAEYYKTPEIVAYFYNRAEGKKEVAANDRWGQNTRETCGDFYTSETDEVVEKMEETWEENRSMSESYGYNKSDSLENYVTPEELIQMLVRIVAKGGNLNLIVNPDGQGSIPQIQVDLLNELGDWLAVNGEAIYGSRPYETLCDNTQLGQPVWYTSSKDKKYGYAIIFDWPKGETFICTNANITWETEVYMLGYDTPLEWVDTGKKRWGLSAKIPEEMLHNPNVRPSKYAWVLKFEHDINHEFH
jgi:alpha-L-fucosidase